MVTFRTVDDKYIKTLLSWVIPLKLDYITVLERKYYYVKVGFKAINSDYRYQVKIHWGFFGNKIIFTSSKGTRDLHNIVRQDKVTHTLLNAIKIL